MPMTHNSMVKGIFISLLMCTLCINYPAAAITVQNDSTGSYIPDTAAHHDKSTVFKPTRLVLPAALIAVGTFGVYNGAFRSLDNSVKESMDRMRGNCFFRADDYVQYLPAVAYLGLGAVGVKSKHTFKERLAVGLTAYAAMTAIVNSSKYAFKEKRPDSNARNSFPSGHTSTVFTGAELIREEYGAAYGIAAYGVATGVAFLRLYNGRHWLNDVIAGAGVGILSARIGYWMLPLYRKWFNWNSDRPGVTAAAVPGYDYTSRTFSLNFAIAL